jgi:AcrR family transcriptional regulator
VSVELGLRERKKAQTRGLIGDAAHRLFLDRGFEAVTVAEVARAADVSEATVFNYFPTKEDLFFGGMVAFEAELVESVRTRAAGESVPAAFGRFVLERSARLAGEEVADVVATTARIVTASPALQAREREIVARYTDELAALIAEETGRDAHDAEPWAVANALMGVQRALVRFVRASVLDGTRGIALADGVRAQAGAAFAVLDRGLAGYGVNSA